jgi:hypothetical protein
MGETPPRVIAFYLPQFHPTAENDAFWGAGFPEWTHVASANPLYRGPRQPKIPGELGFYDLRTPETREAQAGLARAHGIAGFFYWHYWFAGRRLLRRPFEEVLASGKPDFPFCLGWANESWTGRWHNPPERILCEQTYGGRADFEAHFETVLPALRDPRYLRVEEHPLFAVYRPNELPDAKAFCDLWRALAARAGLPGLHLVGFGHRRWDPTQHGFDASILHGIHLPGLRKSTRGWRGRLRALRGRPVVYSYRRFVERGLPEVASPLDYPVALSNWDNTPRAGKRGIVLEGGTPELFRQHLREAIGRVASRRPDQRIVFLKSWNEWAEGNYVEPDRQFGTAYLEVIRDEVARASAR